MALIVKPIVVPASLTGQSNGRLASSLLSSTPGMAGGPTVRLLAVAARAWRAMTAAAQGVGIILQATSSADSYRTYDQQVTLFTSRYQTDQTLNGWRLWDSDNSGTAERWYKKDNVASAAVPGTSNHGWALAVDVANASGTRLDWLQNHALAYGWSWELVPEEPWHLHYYTGDTIPAAVLDYEEGPDMAQMLVRFGDDPAEPNQVWLADGQFRRRVPQSWLEPFVNGIPKGPVSNAQVHGPKPDGTPLLPPLTNGGAIYVSLGDKDVWGIDIATLQGGAGVAGPVDVTDAAAAKIATAVVDEEHNRLAQ